VALAGLAPGAAARVQRRLGASDISSRVTTGQRDGG
jgi:hypothetical protein